MKKLSQLEDIIPALETSHAVNLLEKLATKVIGSLQVVICCSGHGDKDVYTAIGCGTGGKSVVV